MQECSVQKSLGSQEYNTPDDTSVVVREPPNSDCRKKALKVWTKRVEQERGLPPVRVEDNEDLFTSLNNEDLFQLMKQSVGECRVPSIILKETAPRTVRANIAQLLNSRRDIPWMLKDDGTVDIKSSEWWREARTGDEGQGQKKLQQIPVAEVQHVHDGDNQEESEEARSRGDNMG